MKKKLFFEEQYPLLDIAQYIASLFVILIHCGRLVENDHIHFLLKTLLGRMAVPLFLVSAGYFFHKKQKADPSYGKHYAQKQWRTYLWWSLLYLPYGLWLLYEQKIPLGLYPIAAIFALSYLGTCYHLWYFPALLCGLWLVKKLQRFGWTIALAIGIFLFSLGAAETYSSYLSGIPAILYNRYREIFLTTRNGFTYSYVFLLLGFILAEQKQHPFFQSKKAMKLGFSVLLLLIEGGIVFVNQGDDKNFLFALLPLSVFLVNVLLHSNCFKELDFSKLRQYSHYLFFLHPFILEFFKNGATFLGYGKFQGLPLFVVTVAVTTIVIHQLLRIKVRVKKNRPERSMT